MTARPPTLDEPIEVAKFFKTRWRNESVHVRLSEYEGNCLIDIRVWRTGTDGIDRPSTKGLALSVRKLPELARALVLAEAKAIELNLIPNNNNGDDA